VLETVEARFKKLGIAGESTESVALAWQGKGAGPVAAVLPGTQDREAGELWAVAA